MHRKPIIELIALAAGLALVGPFAWLPDGVTILAVVLVVLIYGPARLSRRLTPEWPAGPAGAAPAQADHAAT